MDVRWTLCCILAVVCVFLVAVESADTTQTPDDCSAYNDNCKECVTAFKGKCFYCLKGDVCAKYPAGEILPIKECDLEHARWGTCTINFKVLIITMSVIGGVLILSMCCGIYCCCCRKSGNSAKYAKEDARTERQRDERKMKGEQKKAERKAKNDEIRRKYGLMNDDDGTYHKLDNP